MLPLCLLNSCSQDMSETSTPSTEEKEVTFTFFSSSIEELSRADITPSETFKFLDVAFFNSSTGKLYKELHQVPNTNGETFGKMKVALANGTYDMVAIANAGSEKATITSATKASFADSKAYKTQYCYKQLTVDNENETQNCSMKWGNAAFKIQSTAIITGQISKAEIEIKGKCGNIFNPKTGYSVDTEGISRSINNTLTTDLPGFRANCFLASDEEKVNVTVKLYNDDKLLQTLSFTDVQLKVGCLTTYKGALLGATDELNFEFNTSDMASSGADKEF